jgi:spore maturation protein SpmB
MEQYFYFGEATVETPGECILFPLSSFLGMRPASASSIQIHYMAIDGSGDADNVLLTHTGTTKAAMNELAKVFSTKTNKPVTTVAERLGTANAVDVTGIITAVAVTKS